MLGCGRIGFEPGSAPADAACQFGPWGTPMHIAAPSSDAEDWGGQVTADGLAIYFASSRDGDFYFYVARRPDRASEFGSAQRIDELSSAESENDLTLTPDELEVYFSVTIGSSLCMFTTRATPTGMFGAAERLDALCGTEGAAGGFITADGLSLYYNTVTDGSDSQGTIMVATRGSRAEMFTSGTPIRRSSVASRRDFPRWDDGLTLYFESGSPHRPSTRACARIWRRRSRIRRWFPTSRRRARATRTSR